MIMNFTLVDNAYSKLKVVNLHSMESTKDRSDARGKKGKFFLGCVERKSGCASMVRTAGAADPLHIYFHRVENCQGKAEFPQVEYLRRDVLAVSG